MVHLHHFSKIKSPKEVTKQLESRFFLLFCLLIEGSGSIPLTNGSGSGMHKNMWIRWIKIWIRIRIPLLRKVHNVLHSPHLIWTWWSWSWRLRWRSCPWGWVSRRGWRYWWPPPQSAPRPGSAPCRRSSPCRSRRTEQRKFIISDKSENWTEKIIM